MFERICGLVLFPWPLPLLPQGEDDKVVPPDQAVLMHSAIKSRGLPTALLMFPGEGHGFRGASSIRLTLDGMLYFLGRTLGFKATMPQDLPTFHVDNLDDQAKDAGVSASAAPGTVETVVAPGVTSGGKDVFSSAADPSKLSPAAGEEPQPGWAAGLAQKLGGYGLLAVSAAAAAVVGLTVAISRRS